MLSITRFFWDCLPESEWDFSLNELETPFWKALFSYSTPFLGFISCCRLNWVRWIFFQIEMRSYCIIMLLYFDDVQAFVD